MEQQQCGHRPPLCLCGCALLRHTCVTRAHAATRPMRALVVLAALQAATAPTRVPSPTALAGLDPAAIRARVSSCGNFGVGDVHTWLRPERLVALANAGDEEGCVYVCALHRTYPRPGMGAAPQPDSTSRAACLETHEPALSWTSCTRGCDVHLLDEPLVDDVVGARRTRGHAHSTLRLHVNVSLASRHVTLKPAAPTYLLRGAPVGTA
jgi:hypothetical protein